MLKSGPRVQPWATFIMHNPDADEAGVRYRIDDRDTIVFVDETWDRFAESNDGAEITSSLILGRSLWDFISDEATLQLYQHLVARIRQGRQAKFDFRCDSPSCRRHLAMTIHALPAGSIEFSTQCLRIEERPPMALLARGTTRSVESLRVCAWCNRIDLSSAEWLEVEVAVERLKLFESSQLPQLTHGMCMACFARMSSTLDDLKANL